MKIYLTEGTKYDNQAADMLVKAGVLDTQLAKQFIEDVRKGGVHAFVHSDPWLLKYLKGIARMVIKDYNQNKPEDDVYDPYEWLNKNSQTLDSYLTWVKENREKIGSSVMDDKFLNKMSIEDVEKELKQIEEEREKKSKEELADREFGESNFDLDMINSFDEFNSKYGGRATGDGTSDKWAGAGGTAWCHANDKYTYNNWVSGNNNVFFVLYNKDWKNIPYGGIPDPNQRSYESGENPNPKDAYGNSLIAIRVGRSTGKLLNATLRCNHLGVPKNPDNQYKTYAELSDVAGFNVEEKVKELLGIDKEESSGRNKPVFGDVFFFTSNFRNSYNLVSEYIPKIDVNWWLNGNSPEVQGGEFEYAYIESTNKVSEIKNTEDTVLAYRPCVYFDTSSFETRLGQKFQHIGYTWTVIKNARAQGVAICDTYVTLGPYNQDKFFTLTETLSRLSNNSSEKKYKLLEDDTKTIQGWRVPLKRIMSTTTGEIGGYIQSYDNLAQSGDCWVDDGSFVYGSAYVCDNAKIISSTISGGALVKDNATVVSSTVYGNAIIWGNASVTRCMVKNNVNVYGEAEVSDAYLYGNTNVLGSAVVKGENTDAGTYSRYPSITLSGNVWVDGEAQISGKVYADTYSAGHIVAITDSASVNGISQNGIKIYGNTKIKQSAEVFGNVELDNCIITNNAVVSVAFGELRMDNCQVHGDSAIAYLGDISESVIENCKSLTGNIYLVGWYIDYPEGKIDLSGPEELRYDLELKDKSINSQEDYEAVLDELDRKFQSLSKNESYKKKGNRRSERSV